MFIGAFLSGKHQLLLNSTQQINLLKYVGTFTSPPIIYTKLDNYFLQVVSRKSRENHKPVELSVTSRHHTADFLMDFIILVDSCCAFCITSTTIRLCSVVLTLQQVRRVGRRTGMSHPNLQAISSDLRVTYGNVFM